MTRPVSEPAGAASGGAVDPARVLARDVMRTDVLSLSPDDTIESAVEQLEEYGISGAPVVDVAGRPVGVFTTKDVAKLEHVRDGRVDSSSEEGFPESFGEDVDEAFEAEVSLREGYGNDQLARARVAEWMTPRVVHVSPDTPLGEACRLMIEESLHRVFVVDEGRVRGVVSTHDVVRLLARS